MGNPLIAGAQINPNRPKLSILNLLLLWMTCMGVLAGNDLFVIRPDNSHFIDALDGIRQDLGEGYAIHELVMPPILGNEGYQVLTHLLEQRFKETDPELVILMNNKSTHLYRLYQKQHPKKTDFPPAVVLMAVYAEREVGSLVNASGIAYEIQGVTSLVNLRSLINRPVDKIGVLYSPELKYFFIKQQVSCRAEEFELVGIEIDEPKNRQRKTIKQGLKKLIKYHKVDAVWVLNDNHLLTPKLLRSAWSPVLKTADVPVIVGIRWMVLDRAEIGSFAVVPDHFSMGQQAAGMILEIQEDQWRINRSKVVAPLSVHKILNAGKLKGIGLNRAAMLELDLLVNQ